MLKQHVLILCLIGYAYGAGSVSLAESPVLFLDDNLKAAVEEALWIDNPTATDMQELSSLHISSEQVQNLTGLEFATQMTNLLLVKNQLTDIEPISGLQNLRYVYINNNLVSNVSPLSGLTGLLHLNIHENMIQDVSGLSALVNLTLLDIHDNQITDISALLGMTQLNKLIVQQNDIDDVSALAQMTQLETLSFSFNEVSDVSPLAGLTALKDLDLGYNPVEDISILSHLENLQDVKFESCNVVDISSLCALLQLETVRMRWNSLNSKAYVKDLYTIKVNNPGVLLYYDPNPNPPENLTDCTTDPAVGISLCWDPVANGPNYTSYYRVYRSVGDSVTQTPISDWQIGTHFIDTDSQLGQRYSYWVQCAVTIEGDDAGQMSKQLNVQTSSQSRLVISSSLGGEVIEPGEGAFLYDGPMAVTIEASSTDPCFYFHHWEGTAVDEGKVTDPTVAQTTVWVDGDYSLMACFGSLIPCVLSTDTHGSGQVYGAGSYSWGSTVSISAVPDSHYHFVNWTATGEIQLVDAGQAQTELVVEGDGVVTAYFAKDTHSITVVSEQGGEVLKPGEGIYSYDYGTQVTLEAMASTGYEFSHWSGSIYSVANPKKITLSRDLYLTAHFDPIYHALEIGSTAGGEIVTPTTIVNEVLDGSVVEIAVELTDPNLFTFKGWGGNAVDAGCVADPNALATTVLVSDDVEVIAYFESRLNRLYVDDDGIYDPLPYDVNVSDPLENGTPEHPFDGIQKAVDVASSGAQVVVRAGAYYESLVLPGRSLSLLGYDPNDCNVPCSYPVIDVYDCNLISPAISIGTPSADANIWVSGLVLTGNGVALSCHGCDVLVSHCLLVGNQSTDPNVGVIDIADSNAMLIHCTVSDNLGTALSVTESTLSLYNSIVWSVDWESIHIDESSDLYLDHSATSFAWDGPGVFQLDPLFASAGSWVEQGEGMVWVPGDYHLQSEFGRWNPESAQWDTDTQTSPCIGAGDISIWEKQGWIPRVDVLNCGAYGGTLAGSWLEND